MKLRLSFFAKAFCAILVFQVGSAPTLPQVTQPYTRYSDVIDRAFRFSQGLPSEFKGVEYRIVTRYLPSDGAAESQAVFLIEDDGVIRVVRYTLKPPTQSIASRYNAVLQQKPNSSIEDVLAGVTVQKTERVATRPLAHLVAEFSGLSIPTNLDTAVCTDGATYELWVQTVSNDIHITFSDCVYGTNTDSIRIVRWVKAIEAKLENR